MFVRDGKTGFVDETGKEVIPLKYDFVKPFSEGLAVVAIHEPLPQGILFPTKYGFVDKTGKEIVPPKYDYAESFQRRTCNGQDSRFIWN